MELEALGFDEWYRGKQTQGRSPDWTPARVTAVDRDSYLIRNGNSEVRAELAGNFMFNAETGMDMPCVGDWVYVQYYDAETFAIIHDLFPRKSLLRRKMSGKTIDYQMIAANIDVAFILQSCDANFNIHRLERYLVMVNDGHIEPRLVLTKCDLVDAQELQRLVSVVREARIDCPIIPISNTDGYRSGRAAADVGERENVLPAWIIRCGKDHDSQPADRSGAVRHTGCPGL